jgi:hypothetical protein
MCGTNGRCQCIPEGKSCAVGEYCCNDLVCDGDSLTCAKVQSQSQSDKSTSEPTRAPSNNEMPKAMQQSEVDFASGCVDGEAKVSVEIQTGRFNVILAPHF